MKFLTFKKSLSITIMGEDLLNANVKNYRDTRGFRVALSYKFGNVNLKSKNRNFGNEDERIRTNP
jgi:hypothetical protein